MDEKLSGVFRHRILDIYHPLMRGFDDRFLIPHSRNTEVRREDIEQHEELVILATSRIAGVSIVANKNGRQFFVTGHAEYDRNTLASEYFRHVHKGLRPPCTDELFPRRRSQYSASSYLA